MTANSEHISIDSAKGIVRIANSSAVSAYASALKKLKKTGHNSYLSTFFE